MSTKNSNQRKYKTIEEAITEEFKCPECGILCQPIQDTDFEYPSTYSLMDLYVCIYCDTAFVLSDTIDGFTERQNLSKSLVKQWNPLNF